MLSADTTVTWSLLGESNPDCLRTEEACLPLPLSRRESVARFSVCSAGVEPATDGSSSRPLYRNLEYEHMEPPPGADPGRPQYESGAAAVRGGVAGEPGLEPGLFWVRTRCVA